MENITPIEKLALTITRMNNPQYKKAAQWLVSISLATAPGAIANGTIENHTAAVVFYQAFLETADQNYFLDANDAMLQV